MAKGQETTQEAIQCPECDTTMQEATWPPVKGGWVLFLEGILFLGIFVWYVSGALVKNPNATGSELFLNYFRTSLPLVLGLGCLGWGWMVLTGRAGLGGSQMVWHCPACEHAQSKNLGAGALKKKKK